MADEQRAHIRPRRDSESDWRNANPTLLDGEFGVETDTGKMKRGDGSTAWNDLDYWIGGTGSGQVPRNDDLASAAYESDDRYAHRSNNLGDLDSASTARENLGLGTAAQVDTGTGNDEVPTNSDISNPQLKDNSLTIEVTA